MSRMENWSHTRLADVASKWILGKTPSRTHSEYYAEESGFPWAKAEDIREGVLTDTGEHLTEAGIVKMQRIQPGSILVTTAGTIGRVAEAGVQMFCNQAVQAIEFEATRVIPQYGYFYLRYVRPQLQRLAYRAIIPNLSKRDLGDFVIPYPGLEEQRVIVEWLQCAEHICQKAKLTQELLRRYCRAAVQRAASARDATCSLGDLLQGPPQLGLYAKAAPSGHGYAFINGLGGTPYLACPELELSRVQVSREKGERYRLEPGEILLRKSGFGAGTNVVLVRELSETTLFGSNLIRLKIAPQYSAGFLSAWLQEFGAERMSADLLRNMRELERYQVPVLTKTEAESFDAQFAICLELVQKNRAFIERAEAFLQGMMRYAFTGMLTGDFEEDAGNTALPGRPGGKTAPNLDRNNLGKLTAQMRRFCKQLSDFQRELYDALFCADEAMPAHVLLRKVKRQSHSEETAQACIQDALTTLELLEAFGLVERDTPQKISSTRSHGEDGVAGAHADEKYLLDHNGRPIAIERFKLTRDIFEENGDAAGESED